MKLKNFFTIATLTTVCMNLVSFYVNACPACEKQQLKVLRGIAHGAGPESNWDYVIVWSAVAIVVVTLFFTVKWLLNPKEHDPSHIKRTVLN